MGFAKTWFSCVVSEDCVKANAGCGRYAGINTKYKEKYEIFIDKTSKSTSCPELTSEAVEADKKLVPVCIRSQCELMNPSTT